jgi:AcrR family transcriptional regulator
MANPAKKSKGRPKLTDRQVAEMRARIAEHAHRLFQSEGYASISMRRLAKEVGCTPMTLYKYYENKADILRDIWAHVFNELFDEIDRTAARKRNPVSKLNAIAQTYVAYWLNHTDHYRMVFMTEGISQPEVGIFASDDGLLARFSVFATALAEASSGRLNQETLKVKVDLLVCALNGTAHNLITISAYPWSAPDKIVDAAVASILKA